MQIHDLFCKEFDRPEFETPPVEKAILKQLIRFTPFLWRGVKMLEVSKPPDCKFSRLAKVFLVENCLICLFCCDLVNYL